jgi:hypothetical protein
MKTCFKCNKLLPVSDFYTHKEMANGHLGKCKVCTKYDVSQRLELMKKNPLWVIKERERCRKKQEKYRLLGVTSKLSKDKKNEISSRYKNKYPLKALAKNKCQRLKKQPCCICGNINGQRHHEDYTKPMDVIWLCSKHHAERHVQIRNEETIERLKKT